MSLVGVEKENGKSIGACRPSHFCLRLFTRRLAAERAIHTVATTAARVIEDDPPERAFPEKKVSRESLALHYYLVPASSTNKLQSLHTVRSPTHYIWLRVFPGQGCNSLLLAQLGVALPRTIAGQRR